ncbi:MAG: hypothetical protein KAT58_10070 [candidate division Zixibacteria bacterium]|nr:hypothetical protein [candidate division Zixibacteria bacterium]
MEKLLKSWERLLKDRVSNGLITAEQAQALYWIIEMTLRKMISAESQIETGLQRVIDMVSKAHELSDYLLEDSALQELESLLRQAGAIEPKFKAPSELSLKGSGSLGEEVITDGRYFALCDPFDVSILRLGEKGADGEPSEAAGSLSKARTALRTMAESIFDTLPRLFRMLVFSRCPSVESTYQRAAGIYRCSSSCVLHIASTPGILDPSDYEKGYRKNLFRAIINSPSPVILYVCNRSTTLGELGARVDRDGASTTIRSVSQTLLPFLERKGLEIVLADIPKRVFNENGNVSIISSTDILWSRRRKTRIEQAYVIRGTFIRKFLAAIRLGIVVSFQPSEMRAWVEELRNYRALSDMTVRDDTEERAHEIATELVSLAAREQMRSGSS